MLSEQRRGGRRFAVLILVLTLASSWPLPAGGAAGAADGGGASLTVHARMCPPQYVANAFYADCHDRPLSAGFTYTAMGPERVEAETDAAGDVRFVDLAPGEYVVGEGEIPFDFIDRLVSFCAPVIAPGTRFPFESLRRGVRLDLAAGDAVVCDLYYVGSDARGLPSADLTIHNRLCPPGFAGRDFYGACHDTPAPARLEFSLDGPDQATASTDQAGNTAFRVASGRYEVRGGVPGEFATLAVFCAPAAAPATRFPFTLIGGGTRGPTDLVGIELDLAAGDAVVCDWYNTPEGGR